MQYIGRFAPSPTGPLHFGSLIAAVASYLEARTHHGPWLLRMEDLDTPRTMPGAADAILASLEAFGFQWDGSILYQSRRTAYYAEIFERLRAGGLVYPCACTRKEIADSATRGIEGAVYPGTCRNGLMPGRTARAWRIATEDMLTCFNDDIQGAVSQNLARDIGDFVLKRADGLFAYQLAVVADDAAQGVTHVVRGADLLDSTPRQIYLQHLLQFPTPQYAHVPLATNAAGEKLSKQTKARALDDAHPLTELWKALDFLGQRPPAGLQRASTAELWQWAFEQWQLNRIAGVRALTFTG
jgi:glutamyl-Q tRNA(Asp) synthetase